MRARLINAAKLITFAAVIGYLGLLVMMYSMQRQMMFAATHLNVPFADVGLKGAEELTLPMPDGAKLVGYYRPPDPGKPMLIVFHGKGGEVYSISDQLQFYGSKGLGYVALSHRGFGNSTGEATEQRIVDDAASIYDWLIRKGYRYFGDTSLILWALPRADPCA